MRRTIMAVLSCAAVAACAGAGSPTSPSCPPPFVKIDGATLYLYGDAAAADLGEHYATVTKDRGCADVIASVEGQPTPDISPFEDGEASGIPAATALHLHNRYGPTERLIAVTDQGIYELRKTLPRD